MPSEYTLDTGAKVTPEDKGGPRVGIGGRVSAARDSDGAIIISILRGDGGDPESFTYTVRTLVLGPFAAGVAAEISMGCLDLFLPDFTPRSYRLRIVADGGANLLIKSNSAFIATEPYAPAGKGP